MDPADDISKLEELLAAESSDEEAAAPPLSEAGSTFLRDVVENETKRAPSVAKRKRSTDEESKRVAFPSEVHAGDTDSSDDEERRECLSSRYDDYGTAIRRLVKANRTSTKSFASEAGSFRDRPNGAASSSSNSKRTDAYSDPVFGIRVCEPLISGTSLAERMRGREPVAVSRVSRHVAVGDTTKDWVVAGVVVRKSATKRSQKGSQFCVWTLSDLEDDPKTVSLFLFRNAYGRLWKTAEGTVVGVLNPNVLDGSEDGDGRALSVENPDRVLIIGKSKDFGYCKSIKKNGERCTSFVNVAKCPYCIYHVASEYKSRSRRPDLLGNTSGRGLDNLRNKILGRNTVVYGGRAFCASTVGKRPKLTVEDGRRLQSLGDRIASTDGAGGRVRSVTASASVIARSKKKTESVDLDRRQRIRDLRRLEALRGETNVIKDSREQTREPDLNVENCQHSSDNKLFKHDSSFNAGFGVCLKKDDVIDLHKSYNYKQKERAKLNAVKWIKQNGPIEKNDPNKLGSLCKKRSLLAGKSSVDIDEGKTDKKSKTSALSKSFHEMLNKKSAHDNLITQHDDIEQDKYFRKLEMKESLEEKMLNTFKVPCKGVKCLKCLYTNFSASEKCRLEKHPLKVFDTFKRFFKCGQCGNRTTCLDIIPLYSCKNCQESKWQRAPMINEKRMSLPSDELCIRGEEEKFLSSNNHKSKNINLLVPED